MTEPSLFERQRFAIVTGAAAGIGRATVELLAEAGWRVGAVDLDEKGLAGLAAEVAADRVLPMPLDVTDEAAWVTALAAFAAWSGGHLHLLVNNAGIIAVGGFREVPLARARRLVDVNIMGVVYGIHACLPLLEQTERARIINVASIAALSGWPYSSVYSASKAAIYNLTEALAAELRPAGITVVDVLPSFVGTQFVGEDADVAALRAAFQGFSIAFTRPPRIARAIVAATTGRKMHRIVGKQGNVYGFICRYLPFLARFMSRGFGRRYAAILKADATARADADARDARQGEEATR
jgi:NAD(P)-dependent dehydrogenase (short-subunit alcohol dehydrogenase family)